jgi:hypothetical protein
MSTTIYNGYKLPDGVDLSNVIQWARPVRQQLTQQANLLLYRDIARRACAMLDGYALVAMGLKEYDPSGRHDGDLWLSAEIEQAQYRKKSLAEEYPSLTDTDTHLVVFPHESGLYAMLYAGNRELEEGFNAVDGVVDFSYWNNSDTPEDIEQDQWDKRGKLWDDLMPSGVPSQDGLVVDLVSGKHMAPYLAREAKKDLGLWPNMEMRMKALAGRAGYPKDVSALATLMDHYPLDGSGVALMEKPVAEILAVLETAWIEKCAPRSRISTPKPRL